MAEKKIYLYVTKRIPNEETEILVSDYCGRNKKNPVMYETPSGYHFAHVIDVIETEEGSDLHNWIKAAAGENVSIFLDT